MSSSHLASALFASLLVAAGCGSGKTSGSPGSGGASSSSDAGEDAPPTPAVACTVAQKGTSGVVLQGTVLTAAAPLTGEVFVNGAGMIACVAASCSQTAGYASATVLACPDAVISPGLINSHDHTEYDTTGPIAHGTTRWDHRNGWRTGAGGEPKLAEPASTTNATVIAAA
jgi:hypothetical protein